MSKEQILRNNFDSKCDMKVETNSRGHNTTVHVYEGCTKDQVDETIKITIYAHEKLQEALIPKPQNEEEDE